MNTEQSDHPPTRVPTPARVDLSKSRDLEMAVLKPPLASKEWFKESAEIEGDSSVMAGAELGPHSRDSAADLSVYALKMQLDEVQRENAALVAERDELAIKVVALDATLKEASKMIAKNVSDGFNEGLRKEAAALRSANAQLARQLENATNTIRSMISTIETIDADERFVAREQKRAANVHTSCLKQSQAAFVECEAALSAHAATQKAMVCHEQSK